MSVVREAENKKPRTAGSERRWAFGPAVLDERTLELRVEGAAVELERKPLEVLKHLLDHAGDVVTKDALVAAVWPGRIISDSALTSCVARLRTALKDRGQNLIKTQHGYGYRFVAAVQVEALARDAALPAEAAPKARRRAQEAERRQLTVVSCELDATSLGGSADPEAFREVLRAFWSAATPVVQRYEGHVAQNLGASLLLYFGYPAAHDDDGERAVRCGYDLAAAVSRLPGSKLALRVGIHTGPALVEEIESGGRQETLVVGETTSLSARLQTLAPPGAVLISDATLALVPGLFVTKPQDSAAALPCAVHRVVQPSGVRSRLEAAEHLTPFVGREAELELLRSRWKECQAGRGRAVLLLAEPGLGKSRLVMRFREQIGGVVHTWLECRASPLSRNSAYQPVIELLQRGLGMRDTDTPEARLQRLEQGVDDIGIARADALPLLAPMLDLELPERYPPSALSPELKRRRGMELLVGWVLALAKQQPLVLAFEDLHWADPSTLELLTAMVAQVGNGRVLALFTARPEFSPPWPTSETSTPLTLGPLAGSQVGAMLDNLTQQRALPADVQQRIKERAGGVPLFVEELARMVLESGRLVVRDGSLALEGSLDEAVPPSLQASLMARLDRLGEAKHLAQLCAVIGREIPWRLLTAVAGLDEDDLQYDLQRLLESGLLYQQGQPPDASYVFKHALIRDTAYASLLKGTSRELHGRIAKALEAHFPERLSAEPGVVASHFEQAGLIADAVRYFKRATESAFARSAHAEAISQARHGLELIATLPESPERDRQELDLLLTLVNCLMVTHGYAHAATGQATARAHELCARVEHPFLLGRAFTDLWILHYTRGDLDAALQQSEQLVALGQKTHEALFELVGHLAKGWTCMGLGQLAVARESQERGFAIKDPAVSRAGVKAIGHDPETGNLIGSAWVSWLSGYPDQALKTAAAALAQAEAAGHVYSVGFARSFATTFIPILRREPAGLVEACKAVIDLSEKNGFRWWHSYGLKHLAIAYCMSGRLDEGLTLLRNVLAAERARGALARVSFYYGMEAEQCLAAGRLDAARAALAHAQAFVREHGERFWEAELHRIEGRLMAEDGARTADIAARFRKSLAIARQQGARALELRAATSLARLLAAQQRAPEARAILEPVHGAFGEGFETPDLKDAKALLTTLPA